MKKLIIGLAAGAMALGASVVPASAGVPTGGPLSLPYDEEMGSIWDLINNGMTDGYTYIGPVTGSDDPEYAMQLVLMAGLANTLDQCGNGKPTYTLFLPTDYALGVAIDDVLDVTIADLAETPAVVKALLSDHLVAGAVDPFLLTNAGVKKLVAISGYVINVRKLVTATYDYSGPVPQVWTDFYANGYQLTGATVTCNGWVYDMLGVFQPENYVETFGTNNKPPTGSAVSALPETL